MSAPRLLLDRRRFLAAAAAVPLARSAPAFAQSATKPDYALTIAPVALGYAADAAEAITGNGRVLMQSSIDLGQGPVSGAFGIVWSGTIAVGQNSAFRTQGGTRITGAVQISVASNGYINCNNVSGGALNSTCGGAAGAANQIDGTIQCLELVSSPNNPNVHVSNPQGVTPTLTPANLFGTSSFSNTSEAANTCLNF